MRLLLFGCDEMSTEPRTIPFYKLNGLLRFDLEEINEWIEQTRKVPTNIPKPKPISNNKVEDIIRKSIEEVNRKGYNFSQQETRLKTRSLKGEIDGNL